MPKSINTDDKDRFDKVITNAHLITLSGTELGIIHNGAIAVSGEHIAWVGPQDEIPNVPISEIYDAGNQWVTPGLIDSHTHVVYAGDRSNEFSLRLSGKSYEEIANAGGGIIKTVDATHDASFDQLYQESLPRVIAMLNEGVTTLEIKSGYGLDFDVEKKILMVAKKIGDNFPVTIKKTYLGPHVSSPFFENKNIFIKAICNQIMPALHQDNLIDFVDAFCEKIAFSIDELEAVFNKAKELEIPIKLHADQLSDSRGAFLAAKYHALSADHLEYVHEEGIKAMAKSNTVAVLLPGAFYHLQEKQKPPIELLRKYNIPIAIATDCNPGTSPITSLHLIMNMACTFFRLTPEEAIRGVTLNAAKALNMEKTHGSLEVGKMADLVILNIDSPIEWVANIGRNRVSKIMKEGEWSRIDNARNHAKSYPS